MQDREAKSSLAFNVLSLNLVSSLLLRHSFQRCHWIFPKWSLAKFEKKNRERVYRKWSSVSCLKNVQFHDWFRLH